MFKHIWFDFSDTLAKLDEQKLNQLRYSSYAEAVKKPWDKNLEKEYEEMAKKHLGNSGAFRALGLPPQYWSDRVNSLPPKEIYSIADPIIPETLEKLAGIVPISLFTNINPEKILPAIGINAKWFTHIIRAGMVKEPKPNSEGFYMMAELSKEDPKDMLYVGDSAQKDLRPAKTVGMKACLLWNVSDEADYSITKFEDILKIAESK